MTSNHPWREQFPLKTADENSLRDYLLHHRCADLEELTDVFDSVPEIIQQRLAYLEQKGQVSYFPSARTWYAN